jgi:hypothetical protein
MFLAAFKIRTAGRECLASIAPIAWSSECRSRYCRLLNWRFKYSRTETRSARYFFPTTMARTEPLSIQNWIVRTDKPVIVAARLVSANLSSRWSVGKDRYRSNSSSSVGLTVCTGSEWRTRYRPIWFDEKTATVLRGYRGAQWRGMGVIVLPSNYTVKPLLPCFWETAIGTLLASLDVPLRCPRVNPI